MGKIALLVSREEMLYQAHNILQEKKYEIGEMRVIRTEDEVSEARQSGYRQHSAAWQEAGRRQRKNWESVRRPCGAR